MGGRQLDSELGQALLCGSRMALAFACAVTLVCLNAKLVMVRGETQQGLAEGWVVKSGGCPPLPPPHLMPLVVLTGCSLVVLCSSLSQHGAGEKCSCP